MPLPLLGDVVAFAVRRTLRMGVVVTGRSASGGEPRGVAPPSAWLNIDQAAVILGVPALTLRRAIGRHARRGPEGAIEARFDGLVARKLGRLWRVALAPGWMTVPRRSAE